MGTHKRATVKMTDMINATTTPRCPTVTSGLRQLAADSQCTFSHAACGIIPDVCTREVVRNLQPGIDAFVNS